MNMKKRIVPKVGSTWVQNKQRLDLLVLLPEFQSDVQQIRGELGIPRTGLLTTDTYTAWARKQTADSDKNMSIQGSRSRGASPRNLMAQSLETLGAKYNLPKTFYAQNPFHGLYWYITCNEIRPPSNHFSIVPDLQGGVSIATHGTLSKGDLRLANEMLKDMQRSVLKKQVLVPTRAKENFERDLAIFSAFRARMGKPVRKKIYEKGSYLAIASKSKDKKSEKKMRELERLHKSSIHIEYDEKTSKEIGKQFRMTGAAARKAAERVERRIATQFGTQFIPDNKSVV